MVVANTQDGREGMTERGDHDRADAVGKTGTADAGDARSAFRFRPPHGRMPFLERLDQLGLKLGAAFVREFEHGRGFPWLAVGVAAGIVIYFTLPREPSLIALVGLFSGLVWSAWRTRENLFAYALAAFAAAIAAGLVVAKARTDRVAAPRLDHMRSATVVGWIEALDPLQRGYRLTVRVASIEGIATEKTPVRVRISSRSGATASFRPGDGVSLRARLRPPRGPARPGGYDFARRLFYGEIGATGFAFGAPQRADLGPPALELRLGAAVNRMRSDLSFRIREVLDGDTGAIASALIVGLRRGISRDTEEALRKAGLAHILAISGLHMALVSGSVYWAIRALLALFPAIALRRPIRKWAAVAALAVGAFYLLLSGAGIATQRAFIMIAVVFLAILNERPALTMRSIAVAALIVMAIAPETVLGPSFQMSFAAAMALIAVYEWITARRGGRSAQQPDGFRRLLRPVWGYLLGLMITSLIAGLATAPFAAAHFHRVAPLGLLTNLAAMPIVGIGIMPFGVLAMVLAPFGLDPLPLAAMGWGIDQVTAIAAFVAAITPSAAAVTGSVPAVAVAALAIGMVWLALWRTRLRFIGVAAIVAGLALSQLGTRPDILISDDGRLVAMRGGDGRFSIAGRSRSRLTREIWLRADGDPRMIDDPGLKDAARCDRLGCVLTGGGTKPDGRPIRVAIVHRPLAFEEDCRIADIVVTDREPPRSCARHALVFDRSVLATTGAIAIRFDPNRPSGLGDVATAIPKLRRPWHPPPARPDTR